MLALDVRVVDAVWEAVVSLIPTRPPTRHPLGCHRQRIADRDCFEAILFRLVTGCSWDVAGRLGKGSETTLRSRRNEWMAAGVFDLLVSEAISVYDTTVGLDLSDVTIDASAHKAPAGGEGTGRNPTDRGKLGWKWSLATDADGIPLGWVADGANRHDSKLLEPTLAAVSASGWIDGIETLHLDRGYDYPICRTDCQRHGIPEVDIAARRPRGQGRQKQPINLGKRWAAERTNSWLSNFGQLRRNTDRHPEHRLAQFALAVTVILIIKLIKQADQQHP